MIVLANCYFCFWGCNVIHIAFATSYFLFSGDAGHACHFVLFILEDALLCALLCLLHTSHLSLFLLHTLYFSFWECAHHFLCFILLFWEMPRFITSHSYSSAKVSV